MLKEQAAYEIDKRLYGFGERVQAMSRIRRTQVGLGRPYSHGNVCLLAVFMALLNRSISTLAYFFIHAALFIHASRDE